MSGVRPGRNWLEILKFGVFVGVPIGVVTLFNRPEFANWVIRDRSYVVYPPSKAGGLPFNQREQLAAMMEQDKDGGFVIDDPDDEQIKHSR